MADSDNDINVEISRTVVTDIPVIVSGDNSVTEGIETEVLFNTVYYQSNGETDETNTKSSDQSTIETEMAVQSRYKNGAVRGVRSASQSSGIYSITWYEPDGSIDIVEEYSENGILKNIKRYTSQTSEYIGESIPETDEMGFSFLLDYSDKNTEYSYVRKYFDDSQHKPYKVEYLDDALNVMYYHSVLFSDDEYGNYSYTHLDEKGSIVNIVTYNIDGSKSTDYFTDNTLEYSKIRYSNGETKKIVYSQDNQ